MTVDNYLESLKESQIVTIYDDKHNIFYHGKAGYAPIVCYMFEFKSAIKNGIDIIING